MPTADSPPNKNLLSLSNNRKRGLRIVENLEQTAYSKLTCPRNTISLRFYGTFILSIASILAGARDFPYLETLKPENSKLSLKN